MVDRIGQNFLRSGDPVIATYNFTDIAEATGVVSYYLATSKDSSATSYLMTTNTAVYSAVKETSTSTGGLTKNFETSEFNLPRTVKGTAHVNIGVEQSGTGNATVTVQLKKYDGTTETNISDSVTTATLTAGNYTICLKLTCTQTTIKKGERLRLSVTFITSGNFVVIGHDPQNRNGETYIVVTDGAITASRIDVPFRLDL